ncbi:MAG: NINE protein [Oscillatoriales cyanobacterium RM2_1_1]|nr:NINE protein [Oscillatoriales cyanobacterium SM2_3_0]NJO47757.1 NINE protein [Oscillatoriales cyanobacterium RM2_1_1]
MRNTGLAYLLWLSCVFGVCGVHRFYSKKYISGLIWLFTGGFLGIGQLIDLFMIPGMVEKENLKYQLSQQQVGQSYLTHELVVDQKQPQKPQSLPIAPKSDSYKVLKLAQDHPEGVSIADCILAIEKPVQEVKQLLNQLYKSGLLEVGNDQQTGTIRYFLV